MECINGNNSPKLVFLDIDGTIWDFKERIPKSAAEAIRRLKSNGHIPLLCTGRARGNVRYKELWSLGFDGIVAACGCHVEYKENIIYESLLPADTIRRVWDASLKYDVPLIFEGKDKHWLSLEGFEHDDFIKNLVKHMGEDAVILKDNLPDIRANKFSGDVLLRSDIKSFKAAIPEDICFINHDLSTDQGIHQASFEDSNRVIGIFEAVIAGSSKAEGMLRMCEYLKTDIKDSYAVGDSNNDLEMIEAAGVGIAMGNSSDKLKKKADYVTDDLCKDGLYKAFEHFGLI